MNVFEIISGVVLIFAAIAIPLSVLGSVLAVFVL